MKRIAVVGALVCLLCFGLSGCDLWMSGEYLSIEPHYAQLQHNKQEVISIDSYPQLRNELSELVEYGIEEAILSLDSFYTTTADFYVGTAIEHVMNNTAIGAYAVESIDYEIGTNRGQQVVAVNIKYIHSRSDILRMQKAQTDAQMEQIIVRALADMDPFVTIYTEDYSELDVKALVENYAGENPDQIIEMPTVTTNVYPDSGVERVIEVSFTYTIGAQQLQKMRQQVQAVFTSAELYVEETPDVMGIYTMLYSFLMERDKYTVQSSVTPAYSLLLSGQGDSKAFADVYAAMCRRAGLDCRTISGMRDGVPWSWNIARFRGEYFHVDLLRCNETNEFVLLDSEQIKGYAWDFKDFPTEEEK